MEKTLDQIRAERVEAAIKTRSTEVQRQLEESVSVQFDRAILRLNKVNITRITMPGQLMPLEEIKTIITQLLQPTVLSLCTGDVPMLDFSNDIKTEYYDVIVTPHVSSITYALLCVVSDYLLGLLLYYMKKEFIFNFILNDIVRPNLSNVIESVRSILNRKDIMDEELKKTEEFNDLLTDLIESLMIKINVDEFQQKLMAVVKFDVKDKEAKINAAFENSKYFIPDVLYNIVLSGNATDTDIERITRFMDRYIVSHSPAAISELFRHYDKHTDFDTDKMNYTISDRNAYHNLNTLQLLDGLNFVENKIANRIITFTTADADKEFIEKTPVLKNIRTIMDKFHSYKCSVKLENNDIVFTKEDGTTSRYNIRKEGLSKLLNDPFSIFKRGEYVKHTFFNMKAKSALYQTGLTKEEDNDLLMGSSRSRIYDKTPEEKVQHRNAQIIKLLAELKHDKHAMEEYTRMSTQKIREVKYMNPTQTKTYVLEDKVRLFLVLTETEYLYRQLLNEVAAQASGKTYTGGR